MVIMNELHLRMKEGINHQWVPAGGGAGSDMEEQGANHQLVRDGGDMLQEAFTIVRLPSHVHLTNKGLYEPRLVSIGPYHLSSTSTRGMQGHKWRFLRDFLRRENRAWDRDGGAGRLAACIDEVRAAEAPARRCYAEPLEIGSDDFVQLLVLDAAFILEFLLKWGRVGGSELDEYMQSLWIYVHYDLLLVENQIPFFVLAKLFNLAMASTTVSPEIHGETESNAASDAVVDQRLLGLISKFFSLHESLCQFPDPAAGNRRLTAGIHHLLHLQYQRMDTAPAGQRELGWSPPQTRTSARLYYRIGRTTTRTMTPLAIPCVTELQEKFGVTFREKASPSSQFDVTFRRGTMEIPRLAINDGARILLANVLALEQTKDWKGGILTLMNVETLYLVLMNALVSTAADVAVLQRRGVLDNMLSNEEDAAAFFNQLGGCALFDPVVHHYAALFKDTNEYCDSRWNRYMALLKRNHFRSPCSIISLLVAATLLSVSVMSAGFVLCRYLHDCS